METILIPARYYDYHHRLPFEWAQVVRLDGSLNYTIFSLTDGRKHISTKTIGVYDQCLPDDFVRVDKSCIVNLAFLSKFSKETKTVYLTDGSCSKVARRRVRQLADSVQKTSPPTASADCPDGGAITKTKNSPIGGGGASNTMKKTLLLFSLMCCLLVGGAALGQTITSFSPLSAKPGDAVTITGTGFNTTPANNIVFFGATRATLTAATATSITATVPTGATYAPITVLNTTTVKIAASRANFNPVYAPAKTGITNNDFPAKVDFTTGTTPYSIAIGDLDGDGKPELAVANNGSNTVSVFRNTGSSGSITASSFAAKIDFNTGSAPRSVAIGDVDGDGKPDLVVANSSSSANSVSVLRNTGTSAGTVSFATKVDFTTGSGPYSVAIGDLDSDGKPDLATANFGSDNLSVLRNTGTAAGTVSFATKVDFTTGGSPRSVVIGDVDGDGKPDLATANSGLTANSVSVLRNTGTAAGTVSFAAKIDFSAGFQTYPQSVAIGDLNGDGKPELVTANSGTGDVSVFGNGSTPGSIYLDKRNFSAGSASAPSSIAIGDLTGDGKPDLAVAGNSSGSPNISVLRNNSTSSSIAVGSFSNITNFSAGNTPVSIAIGDLDGDGKPDLATANRGTSANSVSVLRNAESPPTISSFSPLSAKPGDAVTITGTGFNTTAANNVVFFGATKATITVATATSITATVPTGATYAPITVLNTTTVKMASSSANFNPIYAPAKTALTTADFLTKRDFGTGFSPESVAIGDLDGDGKPDLAVANASLSANSVSVLRNTSSSGSITAGSFASKIDFSAGTTQARPVFVAIGDLNGDGKPELVTANGISGTVSVFQNTSTAGNISFADKIDLALDSYAESVAIGDLDNDGRPDLAIGILRNLTSSSRVISIFRNNIIGSGIIAAYFDSRIDLETGINTGPRSVALGDLDGDGKLDLTTANYDANSVSVFRNISIVGTIFFAAKTDFTTNGSPYSVVIGDLNGDGKPDLVAANAGTNDKSVSVFRNTGTAAGSISFAARTDFVTGDNPYSVAIGDLDGDGKPDLATANRTPDNVSVLRNTSTSASTVSFAAKTDFATGDSPRSVAIGDLDGDGKPDLAVACAGENAVSVLRNAEIVVVSSFTPLSAKPGDAVTITGTGFNPTAANNIVFFGATRATLTAVTTTSITATVPTGATYAPITVLNTTEVKMASSRANFHPVYFPPKTNITATDFLAKIDFTTGSSPYSVAIGDLDGDGKPDLAVANSSSNTVSVFRNTGSSGSIAASSFAAKVDFTTGSTPRSVAIGDVDGDGKLDLVVANSSFSANSVSVLRNTGTAAGTVSFAAKIDFATGSWPYSVAIGDVDGDGKPDLATANLNSNSVSILRNTGTTGSISFAAKTDFTTGSSPYSVAIGDVDGDGKLDLATANYDANNVSVFRNTGTAAGAVSFAAKIDFATGNNPQSVAIGDLDGDGKPELATANDMTVSVLRNTGTAGSITTSSFAAKTDFTTGIGPRSVVIGDLDGDGKPDLATANDAIIINSVSVLRNTGTGAGTVSFAAKIDFTTGSSPYSVAIGDLDGDGKPDLATANSGANTVSILRNADFVGPSITTTGTPTAFTACAGTASAQQSFTVSGSNLTANITLTAPTGFEVSTTSGSGFGPSVALTQSGGNVAVTTVFVRIAATATGTLSGNIAVASTNATTQNVAVSGTTNTCLFITGFSPLSAKPGDAVTITGTGFNTTPANNIVFFGATRATLTAATATSITATVPTGATYAPITVLNTTAVKMAASRANFNPIYAPAKTTLTSTDFLAKRDFTTGSSIQSVAIGDLDGDGKPDLVTVSSFSGAVSVLRNTSSSGSIAASSFAAKIDFTTEFPAYSVAIGDVDGDGKPDLAVVWNTFQQNKVSVFRNTGTAGSISFAEKIDFTTGAQAESVAIGDLDGDGRPELVTANTGTGANSVSVLRNTGTVAGSISFAAKTDFTTGTDPESVAIGDLDDDGKPDLAVANRGANSVSVLRNTGTVGIIAFATKTDFTTGIFPRLVAIGDLDGDGKPELVTANSSANSISVLRNTGTVGSITTSSFAAKVDFTAGTDVAVTGIYPAPVSVAIGDLDGDGKPDLATANYGSNSVSVLRNTGTAGSITTSSFAAKIEFATATNPISVAIGDLDGDGKPDLATANFNSNSVSVLRNADFVATPTVTTTGTLTAFTACAGAASAQQSFTVSGNNLTANITLTAPTGFEVSTTSGSGFASSLTLTQNGGNVANTTIFVRMAALTASPTAGNNVAVASTGATTRNVAVSGTVSALPIITLGTINSVNTGATNFSLPYSAVTGNPNQYSITTGTPTAMPGFTAVSNAPLGTSPIAVTIPASAANTYNFNLSVRNSTTGCASTTVPFTLTVAAPTSPPTITSFSPLSAKPGDAVTITGTGFNTTSANNIVFFGATRATVTAATATSITATVPTGATYAPISVLNTATVLSAASIARFNPIYAPVKTTLTTADFVAKMDFTTGTSPTSVAIGDLDGDGKPDLAVANNGSNSVSVFRNTGSAGSIAASSFATKIDFSTGSAPRSVAIGDLDGDGKPDLAVVNRSSNSVSVFRNTGSAGSISFAAITDFTTGTSPESVAIGDLDGDGKPDLAVANNGSNSVSVLRNTSTAAGSVSFAAKTDFTTGSAPRSVVIGDLDGDGKPDLATANYGSSSVSVLRNTGTVAGSISFAAKTDFTTGAGPVTVAIGDLDGDGKPDLATANLSPDVNSVSVLRNTGTAGSVSFTAKIDFTTGLGPISVVVGDLDGDGKPDLATANYGTGATSVSVLRNTGTAGSISFAAKIDFTAGFIPFSVAVGDLDGDGKPDLVVANSSSNSVSVFRNAGVLTVTGTPAAFTACTGTASAEQSFTVSGIHLTANVTITAPSGFEVSTTSGAGFGSSLTLTQSGGNVASTTIFVRMAALTASPTAGNVTVASTGATT